MMWWDDGGGWGWMAMFISMLAFWALVIWVVTTVVRNDRRPSPQSPAGPPARDAEQILRERFAQGEIDVEEYERRREVLRRG